MRTRLFVPLIALGLVVAGLNSAGSARADDAKAIIEKAVKAHGGEEKLAKFKATKSRSKGTLEIMGQMLNFTQEVTTMQPDKVKEALELEVMGQKIPIVSVFNGSKGSITANGQEIPLNDTIRNELKEASNSMQIARLTPLLKGEPYTLSPVGEAQVNGKPAVGVRISNKGYRDVTLYFDKESGLMVKAERRGIDPNSGQEYSEERIITEYQTVEGMPAAKKVVVNRDGKKFMDVDVLEVKYLESVDENEFAK
jgi:hypothetical protein